MSLLNPGAGDLIDRLIVLDLKLAKSGGTSATEQQETWMNEREKIADMIANEVDIFGSHAASVAQCRLAQVNAEIWDYEDRMQEWLRIDTEDGASDRYDLIARVAIWIKRLNNERAQLVHTLNSTFDPTRQPDKAGAGAEE